MRFSWRKYLTPNGRRYLMDKAKGYGPDNPRPWTTDDPLLQHELVSVGKKRFDVRLKSPLAPHETSAAMRMHRNGWSNPHILKTLKVKGTQLIAMLRTAMDEEGEAHRMGRPIHDAKVDKGTT